MRCSLLLAIVLISVVSCSDDKSTGGDGTPTYIVPLAVGNRWWGTVINRTGDTPDTSSGYQVISKDSVVNDETWYRLTINEAAPRPLGVWRANRPDGHYRLDHDNLEWVAKLEILYPCREGDQYNRGNYPVTVVATGVPVTAGGRTYRCQVHCLELPTDSVVQYLAPGVGMVRAETFLDGNHGPEPDFEYWLDSAVIN